MPDKNIPPNVLAIIGGFLWLFSFSALGWAVEETVEFGRFGTVYLYYETPRPSHVVLFVSGDGGWNLGVVDMARSLASLDSLVVGIDIVHYLGGWAKPSQPCAYPAGDLEELSKFVQKRLDFPSYVVPVLVGYSSGATLVYAILVQAPSNAFRGAMSLGFCPDLTAAKPLCRGSGLEWKRGQKPNQYIFLPAATLEVPWIVLQGDVDQVCDPSSTERYVEQVKMGELISLPKVGHGFSVQKNWLPQFHRAFADIFGEHRVEPEIEVKDLAGLPLIEVPAAARGNDFLAVHLTGDGGWGVTDKGLSAELAKRGIPVVALNSLKYFWTRRSPESAAQDLARIIRLYTRRWNKSRVILIGYSLGADVLPFLYNRLPEDLQEKVNAVVLLGPSRTVEFEFHLADWLGRSSGRNALPVLPEVEKIRKAEIICFFGEKDEDQVCRDIDPKKVRVKVVTIPTGHRFGRNFEPIAQAILEELSRS